MRAGVDARASAWGAVASATGAVGLGFLLIGLFIWLDSRYDVVTAWLVVGLLLILIAPAITGVFWGAPLIARELETGTSRLTWNQSVTRTR